MDVVPCSICASTDLKLVDGYYYCVECGTQDTNVRETILEQKSLADGTFAATASRRLTTVIDKGIEMSEEWYKWHSFNFVLEGLADQLIKLGALPSFKTKLLWIWTRYMKKYQDKHQMSFGKDKENSKSILFEEDPNEQEDNNKNNGKEVHFRFGISQISKQMVLALLYVALNLDKSDIQLSHLIRFVKEGHLSFVHVTNYIPDDINLKAFPQWHIFTQSSMPTAHTVRATSMTLMKKLDLGSPLVPDLRKIIDNFTKELCLPVEMKEFVFSLINLCPCDFLNLKNRSKIGVIRIPDYETVSMSYVLVALKICFGLDDSYEIKLSDAVDGINEYYNYDKCYKIGMVPTNRLFSFRDWSSYLTSRNIMLSKHYLHMAENILNVDDYVFIEHLKERPKGKVNLMDEIAMDILNKLPFDDVNIIPKDEFAPTLTPRSSYTDVIVDFCQEPGIKLLLSEDFTQYSLKYACKNLELIEPNTSQNIIVGINENKKIHNNVIEGLLKSEKSDLSMVLVRNCENKNWLKTKRPDETHVTAVDPSNVNDEDCDFGYDSNTSDKEVGNSDAIDISNTLEYGTDNKNILEIIREEDEDKNIFDDNFDDLCKKEPQENVTSIVSVQNDIPDMSIETNNVCNENNFDDDNISDNTEIIDTMLSDHFNPATFNRKEAIKEIILGTCKKYKIPIPKEYKTTEPRITRKRKDNNIAHIETQATAPKKSKRSKPGEAQKEVDSLIAAYYSNLEKDLLYNMSLQVRTFLGNMNQSQNESPGNVPDNKQPDDSSTIDVNEVNNDLEKQIDNHESINDTCKTANDANSVIFDENIDVSQQDQLNVEGDPKFDEKKYDINQLYMNIENEEVDEFLGLKDDMGIEKIITKKIEECQRSKKYLKLCAEDLKNDKESHSNIGLDDDMVEDIREPFKPRLDDTNFEPLITNSNVPVFQYWLRHYKSDRINKSLDMFEKFELELKQNCPKSFYFVIVECASVINCSAFNLYKCMISLENNLIVKAKQNE